MEFPSKLKLDIYSKMARHKIDILLYTFIVVLFTKGIL